MRHFLFAHYLLIATTLFGAEIDLGTDHRLWAFDAPVHAMVATNGTAYVGGEFSYVGAPNGAIGTIDLGTGEPATGWHYVLGGQVYAAVPDNNGGWFVGGSFSFVPEINRKTLIHIRADGSLDAEWDPQPNEDVWSLALDGTTLYAGGLFTTIAGRNQKYLAALDAGSGQLKEWQPNPNDRVFTTILSENRLYVGGRFTQMGETERTYLAAFDRTTGVLLDWKVQSDNWVGTIVPAGELLYVGGAFENIGGGNRPHLAALNANSGLATSWNPQPDANVNAIVAGPSSLYVGGLFKRIGGEAREGLAEITLDNGTPTAWNPAPEFGHSTHIQELLLHEGKLYVGGDFTRMAGAPRSRLAVFDAATGRLDAADFGADSIVFTLSVAGQKLFIGASGRSVGGVARSKLAALELQTGQVKSWKPVIGSRPESRVFSLALAGDTLYLGGEFGAVGTEDRSNVAAVDSDTGATRTWAPAVRGKVSSLVAYKDLILAGGEFMEIDNHPPRTLAAFHKDTGVNQGWDFFNSGMVASMALEGDTLFLGGLLFNFVGQEPRWRGFAALDLESLQPQTWSPVIPDSQRVTALITRSNVVYAAGSFPSVNGVPRNRLAAIDAGSGEVLPWNPAAQAAAINPLSLATSGQTIFIGGGFATLGGKARNGFAAVEAKTGNVLDAAIDLRSVSGLHIADNLLLAAGNLAGSARDSGGTIVVSAYDLRRLEPIRFARFGRAAAGFEAEIAGYPGTRFVVESSGDLKNWNEDQSGEIGIDGAARVELIGAGRNMQFFRARPQ